MRAKVYLPKRDRKCGKAKNEDFFMVLASHNVRKGTNSLIIYHQNVRSLNGKKYEISIMLQENCIIPHFICLSEHHMSKEDMLELLGSWL
jgi:hypothetical protein